MTEKTKRTRLTQAQTTRIATLLGSCMGRNDANVCVFIDGWDDHRVAATAAKETGVPVTPHHVKYLRRSLYGSSKRTTTASVKKVPLKTLSVAAMPLLVPTVPPLPPTLAPAANTVTVTARIEALERRLAHLERELGVV